MSGSGPTVGDLAIEIVAEDKLRRAIEEGQFAQLAGLGKPHPVFDEPLRPDWWLQRKMHDEGYRPLPPANPA